MTFEAMDVNVDVMDANLDVNLRPTETRASKGFQRFLKDFGRKPKTIYVQRKPAPVKAFSDFGRKYSIFRELTREKNNTNINICFFLRTNPAIFPRFTSKSAETRATTGFMLDVNQKQFTSKRPPKTAETRASIGLELGRKLGRKFTSTTSKHQIGQTTLGLELLTDAPRALFVKIFEGRASA